MEDTDDAGVGGGAHEDEDYEDEEDRNDEREDDDHLFPQQQQQQRQDDADGFEEEEQHMLPPFHQEEQPANEAKLSAPKKNGPLKSKPFGSDDDYDDEEEDVKVGPNEPSGGNQGVTARINEDENEGDENPDIELGKSQTLEPEKMQAILAQFTTEQMSRYECYRRSGFQKANMRRVLQSVAGCAISMPMTIVMSGIAKMFVGELVEIGRMVMTERNETGPLRPSHIREAFRRLKAKGKVPLQTRPRLFR